MIIRLLVMLFTIAAGLSILFQSVPSIQEYQLVGTLVSLFAVGVMTYIIAKTWSYYKHNKVK